MKLHSSAFSDKAKNG